MLYIRYIYDIIILETKSYHHSKGRDYMKESLGMKVYVYRTTTESDHTNGGLTSKFNVLTVIDADLPKIFQADDECPALIIKSFKGYTYAVPAINERGLPWMMGGNFIYSPDTRFREVLGHYPIPVHDRQEG